MNEVTNMSEDNNDVRPDVLSALVAEIRSLREENARRNAELEETFHRPGTQTNSKSGCLNSRNQHHLSPRLFPSRTPMWRPLAALI
ncbi:hypothetical protein E5D57_001764 [Metarhizium anisopliae]|nr:hypothetical protein E5D57_001764 [Metarhizium anisopliae]